MQVNSLLLRNFDGIKAGLGLDEIAIDFTGLPPGLIVFDALNGMGKTTILDNMHPYRIMPYRASSYSPEAFSYYDNTYGEAYKELHFGMTGRQYKQILTIDNDRRKQECILYFFENGRWRALNPDGGTRTYDRAVEGVMGTPRMFFTSIFRCQDAVTISESTKRDMQEVFAELLNSDGLLALSRKAGDVASRLVGHLDGLRREATPLEKTVSQKEATEKELKEVISSLSLVAQEIATREEEKRTKESELATIDKNIALTADRRNTRQRLLGEAQQKRTQLADVDRAIAIHKETYEKKRGALVEKIDSLTAIIQAEELAGVEDEHENALQETVTNLDHSIVLCDRRYVNTHKGLTDLTVHENALKKAEMWLQRIKTDRDHTMKMAEAALTTMKEKAARLRKVPCSQAEDNAFSSTCEFLSDARAAQKTIPAKEQEIIALAAKKDPEEARLTAEVSNLKAKCNARSAIEAEAKSILALKEGLEVKKRETEEKLQAVRKHAAALITKGLAEKELPERKAELSTLIIEESNYLTSKDDEKGRISAEMVAATRETSAIVIDEELPQKRDSLARKAEAMGSAIEATRKSEGDLKKRSGILEELLRQITSAERRLSGIAREQEHFSNEISQWKVLSKALGPDGIIPLEIEDAGPEVARNANELLREYDSRYTVRLSTQEAPKRSKGNAKDVFDILVLDALTGKTVSLKLMSGGQRMWIEDAVTKALCIFNKLANGRDFQTIYTDEKDGSLDAEKKRAYFKMKRRVLELGDYRQEFCITQTPELLALADAVITLKDGAITLSAA